MESKWPLMLAMFVVAVIYLAGMRFISNKFNGFTDKEINIFGLFSGYVGIIVMTIYFIFFN